jgi:hypothetical protein
MLQAGFSGGPAVGHQSVRHQSVSQAGRLRQRVGLTAVRPALPTVSQANDGVLSDTPARSRWQKTPPLVQASASCRLSGPQGRSNFRAQDAPFCQYIWKSGRDCRARAYGVRGSRSSSPSPRSGDNGFGHSQPEDSYLPGVPAPRPLHNGLTGREPLGGREEALNGSDSQVGHLPHLPTSNPAQRSLDDGPADGVRHTSSHGMVGHLGFRHKSPTAGLPALQEERHHEVAGHILPLLNSGHQHGSGLGEALQAEEHHQRGEPAAMEALKHDLPAEGFPHLVVEPHHHQVNGHTLPTLSSGPQEVLHGHSVSMVSSTTQGVPMPAGLRDGLEPSDGEGDESEESAAQPDTRSRKELLAEISRLTEKFERAEAFRIAAEQSNMVLRAELEGQREEFWHSRQMQHDLWRGKLAAMMELEQQEEEGDSRLQGEDEQPKEGSDPFSAWPADDESTDDTSGMLALGPPSSSAEPLALVSAVEGPMLALPAPTPDAGAFPHVKSTSPLKIRETAAKLVSHFMAQRPDPPQVQGTTPSAEVGLQLTSEDGPEAQESTPAFDEEADGGSEFESSEASPSGAGGAPGITSSLQASEAMAKFKQQLREGRTKGLLLQGKMQEGLRSLSPHPDGAHPEGDAQDAQEQPKLKGNAAPSLEAELQLVAFLHRWFLGEVQSEALPRVVKKHLAKLSEQWCNGPTDLAEGGLLPGTCHPLRYLLESGQLGKSGSMSPFSGGQDLEPVRFYRRFSSD